MNGAPVIEVEDLHVWHNAEHGDARTHIVRGVSFSVAAGERFGLVGESGAGKSTTLYALLGLLPGTAEISGSVRFAGHDATADGYRGLARLRGHGIGLVTQSAMNALNPVRRVGKQLCEAMPSGGDGGRGWESRRCEELLDRVGLEASVARRYPHELSGGMRQRVAIAMALATEPKLLLADEATTALDTVVQARVVELLDELCAELDLAIIFASHNLALVADFCGRLATMYAGRIVELATSAAIRSDPRHPYTRLLFAATPDLGDRRHRLRSIPGSPPSLSDDWQGCAFADRCPEATDRCRVERPEVRRLAEGDQVACHRAESVGVPLD